MNPVATQQVALGNALVAFEKRLKIENCNAIIEFSKPQRETMYEVTLNALKISPCYLAFLITAEELRYTGKCDMLSEIHIDHMHQPWRTFAAIINRCIFGKSIDEHAKKPKQAKHSEPTKKSAPPKQDVSSKKSSRNKSAGVVIRDTVTICYFRPLFRYDPLWGYTDTPGVSVSNTKPQAKVDRGKGIDLLSDVALLEATQLMKVLKKSMQDTHMLHASGLDDGVGSQPKVPDALKENTASINEGTGTIPGVLDVRKDQTKSKNESWRDRVNDDDSNDDDNNDDVSNDEDVCKSDDDHDETNDERTKFDDEEEEKQDDEFIHTPDDYGTEPANKEKGDVEMTVVGQVNVNQEGACNQVKDDTQATQKTEGPIPSSSISSEYAAKYLNFENIPLIDTEVVSILEVKVQYEVLRTSPLLTILVSVIPYHTGVNPPKIVTTTSSITIYSLLSSLFPHLQQLTTIPTPMTTEATSSKTVVSEFETLAAFHQRITNLEKDVAQDSDITKEHSVLAEIVERPRQQYVPEKSIKNIRKIKMEHARKQQEPKETITSSDNIALTKIGQKTTLLKIMTKSKSFNKSLKQRAMYHALMESILEDEDAMDEEVADKLKKRKHDNADKDEGPSAGSDRGLQR
nr:hypothetical protein [Tanacetum cinerariifolium]